MLEIGIIVSLAIAMFLALRNFPRTSLSNMDGDGEEMTAFWHKWLNNRDKELEAIKDEIKRGQDDIIAPGDINDAQKRYMEGNPEIAKILFEADQALAQEDLRTAEDLALEALKKDKKCAQAYVLVGKVAALRGAFDEAKEAYQVAIRCNPDLGEGYFGLGEVEYKADNYTDAIENFQRAVILDRSQPFWYATLGKAYMEVRQFAKAAKALKRATALDIGNEEYRDLAVIAEEKQRSHAQAFRAK